eukprot:1140794-Pelagomonas_calceolata.AAC.3
MSTAAVTPPPSQCCFGKDACYHSATIAMLLGTGRIAAMVSASQCCLGEDACCHSATIIVLTQM